MDEREPPKELQNKERGSTTLEQCGWCEHASGTHRFQYCISGSCRLQKSYGAKIQWDTKCTFNSASKKDIQSMIESHEYSIKDANNSIERHKGHIEQLKVLKKRATDKPALPSNRKYDCFNVGDKVAVYVEGSWFFGEVEHGHRHHDGCVSYRLDGIGPQDEGFWGSGYAVPTVLLKSEYDYFKKHPQEYNVWCETAYAKDYNGKTLSIAPI